MNSLAKEFFSKSKLNLIILKSLSPALVTKYVTSSFISSLLVQLILVPVAKRIMTATTVKEIWGKLKKYSCHRVSSRAIVRRSRFSWYSYSRCPKLSELSRYFPLSLYCCRHCYTTESRSWHHGSQNKVILCDDCRIYYKKYGKLPATDETREPPPYMFKGVVEREIRDDDGYLVNGKLALRSRRAIPPVQTTLRSGRNKTSSPVEGNTFLLLTHVSESSIKHNVFIER